MSTAARAAEDRQVERQVEQIVQLSMEEHPVPGAIVVVVRAGRVEVAGGYGLARLDGAPMDAERTTLRVASLAKPFVATAVMQLAEQGRVRLDADVNVYLKGAQVPAVRGWRVITLADLLTHSSGFEERIVGYAAREAGDIRSLSNYLAEELPRRARPPGDVIAYSNHGYALAGLVVEEVSGEPFDRYLERHVFAPLGMRHSSFAQPPPPALAASLADGHRCVAGDEDGSEPVCSAVPLDYRHAAPAGGLVTTGADMGRFLLAQLAAGEGSSELLRAETLRSMQARHFTHHPALPGLAYGFAEQDLAGERALAHSGGIAGSSSALVIVPPRGLAVFVYANGGPRFGTAVVQRLLALLTPAETPPAAAVATLSAASKTTSEIADAVGFYRLNRYARTPLENLPGLFLNHLRVEDGGDGTLSIDGKLYLPESPLVYRQVGGTRRVAFRRGDRGRAITHAFVPILHAGVEFPAAWERLSWHERPPIVNEILSIFATPALLLLLWGIFAALRWLSRAARPAGGGSVRVRGPGPSPPLVALAFAALALAFAYGFIANSVHSFARGGGDLVYGVTPTIAVLSWAPIAIAAATAMLFFWIPRAWRRGWWTAGERVLFTLLGLNAALVVSFLSHWSLWRPLLP